MIDNWVRAYQEGAIVAFPDNGNLKPQDEELRRLREGVKRQRMERELFKKTAKRIRQYIFSLSLSQFHDITETGPDWPSFGDVMKNPG